jgi:predicted dehydrogenase
MSEHRHPDSASTRRDFLKTTAAAAAATTLSLAPAVHAAGSDVIKVGVIGCGGRGSGAADNVLHSAPNVQIVAIGDVFKYRVDGLRKRLAKVAQEDAKLKQLGNKIDLPEERCFVGLDAYEKVLNAGVNYVILATPPGFRPLHIQAAVAAGKHIFAEKPVGVDGPGIRKVLAAYEEANKKGLCVVAGTQRRHQAGYLDTMKRVHGGEIGNITAMRCYWNGQGIWFREREELARHGIQPSDLAFQLNNWYHFVWTCGDHICEQHVHNLDVCNWAMGDQHPVKCVGVGSRSARRPGDPKDVGHIFDQFLIDFEYANGVHMLSMCRQIAHTDSNVSEAFAGTKGTCQADRHIINGQRISTSRGTDPYVQEHSDLIASIRSEKRVNELKNVAESTLTAIMGRMAAYTGKTVTWDKALGSQLDTMPKHLAWDMSLPVPPVAVPGKTPLV